MVTERSEDFRDWDIEVGRAYSSRDQIGLPFYIWREAADSRLTLGRPRYCCVTVGEKTHNGLEDHTLFFSVFNPSKNTKPTGAFKVFGAVAALVVIAMLVANCMGPTDPRPYVSNMSPPIGLVLIAAFLYSNILRALISGLWYAAVTVYRWHNGRFKDEGLLEHVPLDRLEGFQVISAGDAGVTVNGQRASAGHALAAVFARRPQIILTRSAFDYESIADKHRVMTDLFCTQRAEYGATWAERFKKAAAKQAGDQGVPGPNQTGSEPGKPVPTPIKSSVPEKL